MRIAGRLASEVLDFITPHVKANVSTEELDALCHDFMVNQDGTGPELAALWQLQHMAFTPQARPVSAGWLRTQLTTVGFDSVEVSEMIPGMTRLVQARKPLQA